MRAARSWKCRGQGQPVFAGECSPQVRGLAFPKSEPFRGQGHHPAVRPVLPLDPGRMRAVRASPSQPCTSQVFSHFLLARNLFFFFCRLCFLASRSLFMSGRPNESNSFPGSMATCISGWGSDGDKPIQRAGGARREKGAWQVVPWVGAATRIRAST